MLPASYAEGPPRQVPGYSSLHRMVSLLLAERTPPDGRVLVLGAVADKSSRRWPKRIQDGHSMAWTPLPTCFGWPNKWLGRTPHACGSIKATFTALQAGLSMLPHPF